MEQHKINEPISFIFRANGDPSVDNPTAVVRDEVDGVFATLTIGSGLTQVGASRMVRGEFTPDANGQWSVQVTDDAGLDIVKQFNVGDYSLLSIGANVATNEAKLDTIIGSLSVMDFGGGHFG